MRIVILGYIVRGPLGGLVWHHLQYVLGLKQMGHQVLFMEDSDDFAGCYDPRTNKLSQNPEFGVGFIDDIFKKFDLADCWCYFDAHQNHWHGIEKKKVLSYCQSADLLINISGVNPLRTWCMNIPTRVLIDTDPAFTQIKHITDDAAMLLAKAHTHFFSFAENIGKALCTIPKDGIDWKPTRQPIYLPAWKPSLVGNGTKWTTIMQWESYKEQKYNGVRYGMKSLSFEEILDLPAIIPNEEFELAIGCPLEPLTMLQNAGWNTTDPLKATSSAENYQQYIRESKGEFSIAKHGYVVSHSGWFSERSACYLASGKPVIVQDTGFSENIQTGDGLICFKEKNEIAEHIRRINSEYAFHCKKARDLVISDFNGVDVLRSLLNRLY